MISRHDIHGYPVVGKPDERFEGAYHNGRVDPAVAKHIAAVDHKVDFFPPRGIYGASIVRKKIFTPSSPLYARAERRVESQMGVRKKQNPAQAHA